MPVASTTVKLPATPSSGEHRVFSFPLMLHMKLLFFMKVAGEPSISILGDYFKIDWQFAGANGFSMQA